ncbi:MAG TPA: TraB/GumN family protein [Planctomycetota bacterium]|nr:TraB/GumN family protein [Planctomycetota bacterium]
MRRRLPWLVLTGLSLLVLSPTAPASVERGSKLFLWKASSPTTEVYLFGSIHLGKQEWYPLPKEIEGAFEKSKYLVVEADESKVDAIKLQQLALENGIYAPPDSLSKHASAETMKALGALAEKLGLPAASLEQMKPWLLSLTLSSMSLIKLGYSPDLGIDRHFLKAAKDKKEILELESMEFQIKLLAGLSDELQVKFLELTLEEADNAKERMEKIVGAWSKGDGALLEDEMLKKRAAKNPAQAEFQAKLIDERNVSMAKKIGEYLKTKDVHFVVVGSAHLIGEKGIVRLLEKDGFKVQQLEAN